MTPHRSFRARIYVLTEEEGGRKTPFFGGYSPQFYFRTPAVTGRVIFVRGVTGRDRP